jgi:hypothetical protein
MLPNVAPVRSTFPFTLKCIGMPAHPSAAFRANPVQNVRNDVFSCRQHCVRHVQSSSLISPNSSNQTLSPPTACFDSSGTRRTAPAGRVAAEFFAHVLNGAWLKLLLPRPRAIAPAKLGQQSKDQSGTSLKSLTLTDGVDSRQDGVGSLECDLDTCRRLVTHD